MPKIMIADDDVTIQMELEEYLNDMKHEVVGIADNSDMAVEMARDLKPDLIDENEINAVIQIGLYKKELESKLKSTHNRLERSNFSLQREIETRKKAERVLRENEEKCRSLFENAPVGIGISDEKGNILDFNDAILRPGGYSRQDVFDLGNLKRLYYRDDDRERIFKKSFEQGFLDEEPVQFRRKDGTPYDALLSLRHIRFERKNCWQAIVKDVTERKRLDEKREETLSQLRATLEATVDGIIVVSLDRRISVYSRRFMEIWHIECHLLDSGDANQVFAYMLDQLTEPEIFSRKVRSAFAVPDLNTFDRLHLKDRRILEVYSRPQKLDGNMIGRVWSFRDVGQERDEGRGNRVMDYSGKNTQGSFSPWRKAL